MPGVPTMLSLHTWQNLKQSEVCGSSMVAIFSSHIQLVQSLVFTWPNLGLFGPDKLLVSPDDSQRSPSPPQKSAGTQWGWQLHLVNSRTFSEWPQTQC